MGRLRGWVGALVEESFFVGCGAHTRKKKNEKNIFCLDCCTSICPHCAPAHPSHPLLQAYTINSAKVVFLKQRPNTRPFKGSGNICLTCDRLLQEPFHFCSLSCKVDHVVSQGEDLSSILFQFDESDFAFSHFDVSLRMDGGDILIDDEGAITPNSILEDPAAPYRQGCSSNGGGGRGEETAELVKRKKKGNGFFPQIVLSLGGGNNRRKGAPHRSPLS